MQLNINVEMRHDTKLIKTHYHNVIYIIGYCRFYMYIGKLLLIKIKLNFTVFKGGKRIRKPNFFIS